MKCKVTLALTDDHKLKGELHNRKDFEGEAKDQAEAIEKWKSLNGLDGIGITNWPIVVSEIKDEPVEPKKAK